MSSPLLERLSDARHSLRGKLIAIVAGGVVIPLALLAFWATRQFHDAGERLLQSQLDASLSSIQQSIEQRWHVHRGDLALLADNDVVRDGLRAPGAHLAPTDARFLEDAFRVVEPVADEVVFSDSTGRVRWRVAPDPGRQPRVDTLPVLAEGPASRLGAVAVDIPVRDDSLRTVGTMTALVRMSALVQAPTALGAAGATVEVEDARGAVLVRWPTGAGADSSAPTGTRMVVRRSLATLPLRLVARAPLDPFVKPFAQDARRGALLYAAALAVTLAVAGWLALRATRALRRLAEGAEAVANGDLEHQVAVESRDEIARVATAFNAMTRELRASLHEASHRDAMSAVGQFAAELAHEVRNPLTSVRLDLQRLQERLPGDARLRDPLARALSAVERLNRTVTGALRVARSGSITAVPLQLASAIEPAFLAAAPTFTARGVVLHHRVDAASSAWVRGDADALAQLFTNILINAAEAADNDGHVDVSAAQENGSVVVMIADSGPGISAEIVRQLDEPFHASKKRGGSGLGLTIARRIAAAHHGRLEFDSVAGRGTTVRITLPAHAEATPTVPAVQR